MNNRGNPISYKLQNNTNTYAVVVVILAIASLAAFSPSWAIVDRSSTHIQSLMLIRALKNMFDK